jgi:PAS domain S-box-containing protein
MWVFDLLTLKFIQVNKAAIAFYGYLETEFLCMTILDIKVEEDKPKTLEAIRLIKKGDAQSRRLVRHCKKSGEIVEIEIYGTPILLNDRECFSVIGVDFTERNQLEHTIIKAIIKTQEDERYEIGGELHDNVCQILAVSQQSLGMLKESLPVASMPFFDQSREYISLALQEIRNLSHRLAPVFFNDSTLEEAFRRLITTFSFGEKVKIHLGIDENIRQCGIELELQLNLYRILQEQLRNILKYAHATSIEVDVLMYNNKLKMRIADDGVGFNLKNRKVGIGLANMKRRTELFSGTFEIVTAPGEGFTILIDIPLGDIPMQKKLKIPNETLIYT